MENLKRAISAFMALVLVLGMVPVVPMTAGAEEVETQPEIVAVETTEAVTISEETEAVQTTPETTEPDVAEEVTVPQETEEAVVPAETEEETIPQETEEVTVPEETEEVTVPQETEEEIIPEETEEETLPEEPLDETIPQETVEETVPEETLEELVATDDAADAVILNPVTDITVTASTDWTYVGNEVKLTVKIAPEEAPDKSFRWEFVEPEDPEDDSINNEIAAITEDNGYYILTANAPGTVQLRAVSEQPLEEPEEGEEPEEPVASEVVTVTFVEARMSINLKPLKEENLLPNEDENYVGAVRLRSGESLNIGLLYETNDGSDLGWQPDVKLKPEIEWTLEPLSEEDTQNPKLYATLSTAESRKEIVLTAKTVTESKTFVLKAKDKVAGESSILVTVYANPHKVEIRDEEGKVITETITVDLAKYEGEFSFFLYGNIVPSEADQWMSWSTSNNMYVGVEPYTEEVGEQALDEEEAEEEEDNSEFSPIAKVTVGGERLSGTAVITAACKENPDLKASVTIKTVRLLQQKHLDWEFATEQLAENGLVAGKSFEMKAANIQNPEKPVVLTSKQVVWKLGEGDDAYATLDKNGKLTAKSVPMGKVITVYCRVIGNEDEAFLQLSVPIYPKATKVEILDENGEVCNGKTLYVNTAEEILAPASVEPFILQAQLLPLDDEETEELGAKQTAVTWSSSKTTIAKINKTSGEVTWQGKTGTVTFTATAADGSGKKATVNVKFCPIATELSIWLPEAMSGFVRSGESVTMGRQCNVSSAVLNWSLAEGDSAYATISSGGKLKAKTVYEEKTITVIATAEGNEELVASVEVPIKPKNDGILTLYEGDECVTKTTQMLDISTETITLSAETVGDGAPHAAKWSFDKKYVTKIEDDGEGTATFQMKKTGSTTIKATSLETGKTATVTLKGIRVTETVDIIEKEDVEYSVASGKSLTLKAKLYDANGKTPTVTKLKWTFRNEEDYKYAKISAGKVTALSGYYGEAVTVTAVATATDGSEAYDICTVTIRPITQAVRIQVGDLVKSSYTHKIYSEEDLELKLSALVYPLNKALDEVKWSSSDKKIATVCADGTVTCKKAGTVTIMATAKDGSGKKATLKLTIRKMVSEITFNNSDVVAGGKTLTFKVVAKAADGGKPSSSKVTWKIEGDTAYVKSFKNGVLKTRAVTEPKYVLITATAADGSEVYGTMVVAICPATTSVKIQVNGSTITSYTMRAGNTLDLDAISYPYSGSTVAAQAWTWSSSAKTYATVNANGVVTAKKGGKTITITAKAKDGTGKKATIKLTILK